MFFYLDPADPVGRVYFLLKCVRSPQDNVDLAGRSNQNQTSETIFVRVETVLEVSQ